MAIGDDKKSPLVTQRDELIKQKIFYDAEDRIEIIYTANTDAKPGNDCTRVQYTYYGLTGRVDTMKETVAQWDAAWDQP